MQRLTSRPGFQLLVLLTVGMFARLTCKLGFENAYMPYPCLAFQETPIV